MPAALLRLTVMVKGMIATLMSPGFLPAFSRVVSRLWGAIFRFDILLACAIDPVLSRASAGQRCRPARFGTPASGCAKHREKLRGPWCSPEKGDGAVPSPKRRVRKPGKL